MKKVWKTPSIEVLDMNMTMGGPGNAIPDSYCTNNQGHETQEGMSNRSCRGGGFES